MEHYRLTFKDKLYFLFVRYYHKRYFYLYLKVEKHEIQWFRYYNISFPFDFNKYLKVYTENLISEFEMKYE